MDHKITTTSPYDHSSSAEQAGKWPLMQSNLVQLALTDLLVTPFEQNWDLRGAEIRLKVHDDGLHVTAEVISSDSAQV